MKVLVCGGRDFNDVATLCGTLDAMYRKKPISVLIHGAARGADTLANQWAISRCVPIQRFPADWATHGRGAGPIRNTRMLDEGKPDIVVAFPGGRGTANMITQARQRGVTVVAIEPT